jgi:hypothetical protein
VLLVSDRRADKPRSLENGLGHWEASSASPLGTAALALYVRAHVAHEAPDLRAGRRGRTLILFPLEIRQLPPELMPVLEPVGREVSPCNGFGDGTARLTGVLAIAKATLLRQFLEICEHGAEPVVGVPQLQLTHPRRIDEQRAVVESKQLAMRRRVLSAAILADWRSPLLLGPEQQVHERRLPDPG